MEDMRALLGHTPAHGQVAQLVPGKIYEFEWPLEATAKPINTGPIILFAKGNDITRRRFKRGRYEGVKMGMHHFIGLALATEPDRPQLYGFCVLMIDLAHCSLVEFS